jgi:hypothetical protein
MTMSDANNSDGEKSGEEAAAPAASETPAEKAKGLNKAKIGRTAAVAAGIGSAALVAALLYANRSKTDKRKP